MNLEEREQEIVDTFTEFEDWMDKYQYLVEIGGDLPPFPEEEKNAQNLISGCQSQVWFTATYKDGKIYYQGDSDALIVKGLVALLISVLSEASPSEIVESDLHFIDDIGLKEHLSPTRSNGLLSMVKRMKYYAFGYAELEKKQAEKK